MREASAQEPQELREDKAGRGRGGARGGTSHGPSLRGRGSRHRRQSGGGPAPAPIPASVPSPPLCEEPTRVSGARLRASLLPPQPPQTEAERGDAHSRASASLRHVCAFRRRWWGLAASQRPAPLAHSAGACPSPAGAVRPQGERHRIVTWASFFPRVLFDPDVAVARPDVSLHPLQQVAENTHAIVFHTAPQDGWSSA